MTSSTGLRASNSKSQYLDESIVQPFLAENFSPADFLNDTLPYLSHGSTSVRSQVNGHAARAVSLSELNGQLQSLLVQLNAQTSRLSTTLTQLSDDIIRSGGRLAYEVELLGADAAAVHDTLHDKLNASIDLLAPQQVSSAVQDGVPGTIPSSEEHLDRLKQLTLVRSRLDEVIKVFGEATSWPIAPSELSVTSSFISVSAPDGDGDSRDREKKGKEYADKLRREINDLVGVGNDPTSLQSAAERIEDLRRLAQVWKGTSEEKARIKFVDSLAKPIEERQKMLDRNRRPAAATRPLDYRYGDNDLQRADGGYGFLQNLRQLRNEG